MSDQPISDHATQGENLSSSTDENLSMAPPSPSGKHVPGTTQPLKVHGETSYTEVEFEIDNPDAIIRDKGKGWKAIIYQRRDTDLPTKEVRGKAVPDKSFIGVKKTIPNGTKVMIDDVYIDKATTKTGQDKIKYVHCVNFGWTSVGNIKGRLKNESVGIMKAVAPVSNDPTHYTVAVSKAVVLKPGNRYPRLKDNSIIPFHTTVNLEESFSGYYLDNTQRELAKVTYGGRTVYTSAGNFPDKAHDGTKLQARIINDGAAYIREAEESYIPDVGKRALALGSFVVIGTPQERKTGTYVEVFTALKKEGQSGKKATYSKGDSLGWTNMLNLQQGLHTDIKGRNAMWNQVIPDQRYDRAKGKDTEGVAKFTGNKDMIKVVDSKGDIEHVAQEIWPSLKQMLDAARAAGQDLHLNVGFRDWDYQQAMIDGPWAANPVGYSTHQRGIAVDLNNKKETAKGGLNWWMERNAYKFGFVRTYKQYKEGHHWEYLPEEVVAPVEVERRGKKYMKYTFASFASKSKNIWDRNHVLDPI